MTGRLLKIGVPIALLALVVTAFATSSPEKLAEKLRLRQVHRAVRAIEDWRNLPVDDGSKFDNYQSINAATRTVSVFVDNSRGQTGLRVQSEQTGPIVTPIVLCGAGTSYDYQANDDAQHQVATLGGSGNLTHFAYMFWGIIPASIDQTDRFVNYQAYSTVSGLTLGDCGQTISGGGNQLGDPNKARGGYTNVDPGTGDLAYVAMHARAVTEQTATPGNYSSFYLDQGLPGLGLFDDKLMPQSTTWEVIWPHAQVDVGGGPSGEDVFHVVSHPTSSAGGPDPNGGGDDIVYWRRVGIAGAWEGPAEIDVNAGPLNYHVATAPGADDRVAIIYLRDDLPAGNTAGLLNVVYVESANNGADWIAVPFPTRAGPITNGGVKMITNYTDPDGAASWAECHGEYSNGGVLHAVWIEQVHANLTADARVMHWDASSGNARIVAQAIDFGNIGGDGGRDLWLASPQMGFGDGTTLCTDGPNNPGPAGSQSNLDYVYVTYEQYGGATAVEANDASSSAAALQMNLEDYLAVSNDGGNTWSPSINLTNTKTPGCDGSDPLNPCASERDPSIARVINDTIHVFYVLDKDAGDVVFGSGSWTFNPVHYLRIPGGTDVKPVCPTIAPNFAVQFTNQRPDCEYNAPRGGSQSEQLIIQNLGNAALTGNVSTTGEPWLIMATGPYTVNAGAPNDVRSVTLDASVPPLNTTEGLYQATISITHNDTSKVSPRDIPVDFFVFDSFACPERVVLHTGWLWLEVSNVEQVANANDDRGGLARLATDSSWSLYDGSLVIGLPPNPDTLVYRNFSGGSNTGGQPGFRALSSLVIDTSAYGTNAGDATAFANQTTVDSTLGVDVTYVFPENTDSLSEFVLIKYKIFNRTASAITNLVIGEAADFDVMPGVGLGSVQSGSQNTGHLLANLNALYQEGVDTLGHIIVGDTTATRYQGGMTAIQTSPAPRGWIAANDPFLFQSPGGYFAEGYLYRNLVKSGFELFPDQFDPAVDAGEDKHAVLAFDQNVTLNPGDVKYYCVGLVSSNTGPGGDATDITNTIRKAWDYCFGWTDVVTNDTIPTENTPKSYPYHATGSNGGGISSGCLGCVVTKVSGAPELTISPGADPCDGTIEFAGGPACGSPYTATFNVTDQCSQNSENVVVTIIVSGCSCSCPFQGDINADGSIDPIDLSAVIDIVFFGGTDPQDPGCGATRGDFNNSGSTDPVDLSLVIDYVFFGGAGPVDPCSP